MPARSTFEGRVYVYTYRCPVAARAVPVLGQMRLGHDLRNKLVEIERAHADAVAGVWAQHPEVAATTNAVSEAKATVEQLVDRAKQERIHDRSTTPRTETRSELQAARAELKQANVALKAAKQDSYAEMRSAMQAAQNDRKAQVALAGTAAKADGLLWHTHDAVLADHEIALKAVMRLRRTGKPAELHFHRWTGEGRIRVTLMRNAWKHNCGPKRKGLAWPCGETLPAECTQRVAQHPPRTAQLLSSGTGPWNNVVRFPPEMDPAVCAETPLRGHGNRATISLRVGSDDNGHPIWWELPVFVHRPLDPDADVTYVEVIRRRIAGNWRVTVSVTCRLPTVPSRTSGSVAAIDLGWRHVKDGIRVGVIASTGALPALPRQPELAGIIRPIDGHHAEIVVLDSWRDVFAHTMAVRGIRDQNMDSLRRKVVDALAEGVEGVEVTGAEVVRWRAARRFAVLARQWPQDHELAPILEAWRKQDKHLWEGEAHERDQIVARRRDAFRKVAAWLMESNVAMMVFEEVGEMKTWTRIPDVEEGDERQKRLARAQHQIAAPGELRSLLVTAAANRGVRVVSGDPFGITRVHSVCGQEVQDVASLAESVMVWCSTCQLVFDQDVNAADNLISRTIGDSASHATIDG